MAELGLWSSHWTDPAAVTGEVVLLDSGARARDGKAAALACYPSQSQPLAPDLGRVLPPDGARLAARVPAP